MSLPAYLPLLDLRITRELEERLEMALSLAETIPNLVAAPSRAQVRMATFLAGAIVCFWSGGVSSLHSLASLTFGRKNQNSPANFL